MVMVMVMVVISERVRSDSDSGLARTWVNACQSALIMSSTMLPSDYSHQLPLQQAGACSTSIALADDLRVRANSSAPPIK